MSCRSFLVPLIAAASVAVLTTGCPAGNPMMVEVPAQTVAANEQLTFVIPIENPGGVDVTPTVRLLGVSGFEPTLTAGDSSATFAWVPLVSHVGTHSLIFRLEDPDDDDIRYDEMRVQVTVNGATSAVPQFTSPPAGATYDITEEPCISFNVEVRDDDSTFVPIGLRPGAPDNAFLVSTGDKTARLDWCPTNEQLEGNTRFQFRFFADDEEHDPVDFNHDAIIRFNDQRDCPGTPPTVEVVSPVPDDRITSRLTYRVEARITDDATLRDPPLLYYRKEPPTDPDNPDVTEFSMTSFERVPGSTTLWVARITDLALEDGASTPVYYIVSATDNNDSTGARCDLRTETDVRQFTAVRGPPAVGSLATCEICASQAECMSGICGYHPEGHRCLATCGAGGTCTTGSCGPQTRLGGGSVEACGSVDAACLGAVECIEDSREDDDTLGDATPQSLPSTVTDGQICAFDDDYFRYLGVGPNERITVTLSDFVNTDGDLDLYLYQGGLQRALSASEAVPEVATFCARERTTVSARVLGHLGAENGYSLTASSESASCCVDDEFEPDDDLDEAGVLDEPLTAGGSPLTFGGTICADSDDYLGFDVSGSGMLTINLTFSNSEGDMDLWLLNESGTTLVRAETGDDNEMITTTVTAGRYYILIYLFEDFLDEGNGYNGEIRLM